MTEKERMLCGQLYIANNEELARDMARSRKLTRLYNGTTEEQMDYRVALLKELPGSTGETLYIEPPFRCGYGCHISVGDNFYANYDCIILDVRDVAIGDNVFFGPGSASIPPGTRWTPACEAGSWSLESPSPLAVTSGWAEVP